MHARNLNLLSVMRVTALAILDGCEHVRSFLWHTDVV